MEPYSDDSAHRHPNVESIAIDNANNSRREMATN